MKKFINRNLGLILTMLVLSLAIAAGEYVSANKEVPTCSNQQDSLIALAAGCQSTVANYLAKQK